MKINFFYGPFSAGDRRYSFSNILDDSGGLTGSEYSCFYWAQHFANLGHQTTLYTYLRPGSTMSCYWGKVLVKHWHLFGEEIDYDEKTECSSNLIEGDVSYVWNEPNILYFVSQKSFRMTNQQLNDFTYCREGYDGYVDAYTSPSQHHMDFVKKLTPSQQKWNHIPNCIDAKLYNPYATKRKGSVLYASSNDRGLHLLLQEWSKIKDKVPEANLKIFYDYEKSYLTLKQNKHRFKKDGDQFELLNRLEYVVNALDKMKTGYDITHLGAISKNQVIKEMNEAMVLAYPCSTIRMTEGFSYATMEACAAGMVPIISEQDSLKDIYGDVCPMVKTPTHQYMDQFSDLVIKALTNEKFREEVRAKTIPFSHNFTFENQMPKLEKLMMDGIKRKKMQ